MGDPFREVMRLEQFNLAFDGLESFSVSTRMKDFVSHYFSRFIINIKNSLSDFSQSELQTFLSRYSRQVDVTLSDPLLVIDDIRVNIPKGMLNSYYKTTQSLLLCLAHIHADRLVDDIRKLTMIVYTGANEALREPVYTKVMFEADKKTIGSLYNPTGLSYSLGGVSLVSLSETKDVKDILASITRDYYPQVIQMSKDIDTLEMTHERQFSSQKQTNELRESLMETAYRVSIFAVVMDHIQNMEHAFVLALTTLKNASHRHR